jgi:hypothetical protein
LRSTVERYRDDGTGLVRHWATDEEWALAQRVSAWFQGIASASLAASAPAVPASTPEEG